MLHADSGDQGRPIVHWGLVPYPEQAPDTQEASAETWTQLMDSLCREGELSIISKLRWKASRFGGRPFALPSATSAALAASRRRKGKAGRAAQVTDFMTEVRISGDPGLQDKAISDDLMRHPDHPKLGTFRVKKCEILKKNCGF